MKVGLIVWGILAIISAVIALSLFFTQDKNYVEKIEYKIIKKINKSIVKIQLGFSAKEEVCYSIVDELTKDQVELIIKNINYWFIGTEIDDVDFYIQSYKENIICDISLIV